MNKNAYELANEIDMSEEIDAIYAACSLYGQKLCKEEAEKYRKEVSEKIRKSCEGEDRNTIEIEKIGGRRKGKRHVCQVRRGMIAVCAAAFLCSIIIFGEEVRAAVAQIGWSISSALGLSEDMAEYVDIINTSATDAGYVITLQEAAAAEDKLVVTYTLQRENGEPFEDVRIPEARFFINDTEIRNGVCQSADFINEDHTVVGIDAVYDVVGIDMAKENRYQLIFNKIDSSTIGAWDFEFTADGTDLAADSRRISLQKEFTIDEKADIILEELVLNKLEQKISFHIDGPSNYVISNYDLQITAEDEAGHSVKFEVRRLDGVSGDGYLLNNIYQDDGWIDKNAELLTLTFSVGRMIKENDQTRLGDMLSEESFTVELP